MLRIAALKNDLSLWQAGYCQQEMDKNGILSEIVFIKDMGKTSDEGDLRFHPELQEAVANNEADIAVHAYDELPLKLDTLTIIAGASYREPPYEIIIIDKPCIDRAKLFDIWENGTVGVDSLWTGMQINAFRTDLNIKLIKGDIHSRLARLKRGEVESMVISYADINRLQMDVSEFHVYAIPPTLVIPPPARGILAYQCRKDDQKAMDAIGKIQDNQVWHTAVLERSLLKKFPEQRSMVGCISRFSDKGLSIWAGIGTEEKNIPTRVFMKGKDDDELILRVAEKLKSAKERTVFISRKVSRKSYLYRALTEHGYKLIDRTLLEFKPVEFHFDKPAHWVFFTDPRGVEFYFAGVGEVPEYMKFGALNHDVAAKVREYGRALNFVGNDSEISAVADEFAGIASGQTVLFPQSKTSQRNLQKELFRRVGIQDLVVYSREPVSDFAIPDAEILIFTSPKAARTYMGFGDIREDQAVIAVGPATEKTLKKLGIAAQKSYEPSANALVDLVFSL